MYVTVDVMNKWVSRFSVTLHLCQPHVNCLDYECFFFSRSMLPSSLSTTLSLTNKTNGLFEWCNQLKVTMTCNDAIIKRRSIFFAKILTVHFFLFLDEFPLLLLLILTFKYKTERKGCEKERYLHFWLRMFFFDKHVN